MHLYNLYIILCKFLNLPLKKYFINVFNKCGWKKRNDIIFDQLNPAYSKYYKKEEIEKVLTDAGFINLVSFLSDIIIVGLLLGRMLNKIL